MRVLFKYKIIWVLVLSFAMSDTKEEPIIKNYIEPGPIEALIDSDIDYERLILVQLNLSNDSLFTIVDNSLPNLELMGGPATYHRVFPIDDFRILEESVSSPTYIILKDPYNPPDRTRDYWIEIKQGS